MKLESNVALVVGGASGIARACAEACADEGAAIMIADVNEAGAGEVLARIDPDGVTSGFVAADITDEKSVEHACVRRSSGSGPSTS